MSYVDVPSDAIFEFLRSKGFTERRTTSRSTEVVYERAHERDGRYKVVVYTSVRRGEVGARECGRDAIRVCAIWEDGTRSSGVAKLPRVHRTGSVEAVLERTLERMRAAYARCNEDLRRRGGGSQRRSA